MSEPGKEREQRVRGPCGFFTGWFDPDDAYRLAKRHARKCDSCEFADMEYKEREKQGTNYSDSDPLPPGPKCPHCGSGNVEGAVSCGGCGGDLLHAI